MMEGWEEYKLDDIGSFKNGANFSSDKMGSGIPLVNVKDITDSPLLHPERMDLVEIDISSKSGSAYLAKEGDIFFVRSSVKRSGVGAVGMLKNNDSKVVHCGFVIRFRLTSELILPRFAFYLFNTSFNREKVRNVSGGATIVNISQGSLKMLKFKFPPLNTQRKIASILSAYDDLIENNLKRIKLLEEQAQLTYEEWFVRFKFPGHETTNFDEETGLPEGWEVNKVGSLLGKIKSTKKIKSSEILETGIIPVVDQSRSFIKGFTNEAEALINIDRPIIVFGDHTRVLKFINFPFARGADGTQVILSKSERMPQHLFYFTLKDVDLSNYHYARHFKFLKDSEVIVPTKNIAENFEEIVKKNYDLILNLQHQNQHLKEARDMLLPRLMSGMIDVEKLEVGSLKYEVNDSLGMVAEGR